MTENSPETPTATIEHYCGAHAASQVSASDAASAAPTLHYRDTQAEIHRVVVGDYENNVFVVRCRSTGDAVLIDAANEHGLLLELSRKLGVRSVVETHGHHDHIGAVTEMRDAGYSVWVAQDDAPMLPSYAEIPEDEAVIEVGRLRLHTIPGGPGATKFEGGSFETIIESIETRMFSKFAPDTLVMPGHGDDTTIGTEKPHFDDWVARGW